MIERYKRAEFVVQAESTWGLERGVNFAMRKIEEGILTGRDTLSKHGVSVEWRILDIPKPVSISEGSIITPEAPAAAPNTPDISSMDIEEAKGLVGTASGPGELDLMETAERSSTRVPGGRKGVLVYIDRRRKEFADLAEKRAREEAEKAKVKKTKEA